MQETSGATVLANILPGLGIDEFLTRTDVVAGVTSSFLTDALGSPVAVTNNSGVVQTEYTYEPFGKTTVNGSPNSSYQYTGRENDGTGLYYYRARYYHPELQRFVTEDPIEFDSGDINLYAYVTNNPMLYVDPNGWTHAERHGSHRRLRDACKVPGNCFPPPNKKSSPLPPAPPEPKPYPDVCKEFGCTTDQGRTYPNGSDESIGMHPPDEGLRGFGDATKIIIRQIINRGRGGDPDA